MQNLRSDAGTLLRAEIWYCHKSQCERRRVSTTAKC